MPRAKPVEVPELPQLITADELGRILAIPTRQVYAWVATRRIPADCVVRLGERTLRFDQTAVARWLSDLKAAA